MDQNILEWMIENDAKTETGKLMDVKNHAFMMDFLLDETPKICSRKAAQITFTTHAIFKVFYEVQDKKLDAIYTMPSASDAEVLVSGKVNRILLQNDQMFKGKFKNKDSVRQKEIGDNMIYFRGTRNEQQAISVSADLLIFDEYDRSDQRIIEMYSSRLQHSDWKKIWLFSNPSFENVGVDRYWHISDQKHWFITCPHCKFEQFLSFPDSVDLDREIYVCKKCHGELEPKDRARGRWRKKFLNREWSGYWINLMMLPTIDAKYVINEHKTKTPEYFANFVMGLPYIGGDAKLSQVDFIKNLQREPNSQKGKIVIGVDTGLPIWYVVGNQEGIFYTGKTPDYTHLEYLMDRRFPDAIMVIDAGGDLIGSRKMLEKYPGRVFLCHFGTDRKTLQLIQWKEGDESGYVIADRNRMIQMVFDEFRDSRIPLFGKREDYILDDDKERDRLWTHINNVYRTETIDGTTKLKKYVYEGVKPDHLLFAAVYWRVGMDKYGFGGGEFINTDQEEVEAKKGVIVSTSDSLDEEEY